MSKTSLFGIVFALLGLTIQASATILPPNHLDMFDDVHKIQNITPEQFSNIIDQVVNMWQPYAQLHGATLSVNKLWDNSTVNASAQQNGNRWILNMYGGLARRPEVTPDGFALVVCHELGHHFGGYYFYSGRGNEWAASEGEADYFATQVCGRAIFAQAKFMRSNAHFRATAVPEIVKAKCDAAWHNQVQQDVCYRISAGGHSLATLLGKLGGGAAPRFETPDMSRVSRTVTSHPQAQCRLDTYFQGALCTKMFNPRIIPGKGERAEGGSNSLEAEQEAGKYSCMTSEGFNMGYRPTCWFKQQAGNARFGRY